MHGVYDRANIGKSTHGRNDDNNGLRDEHQ